MISTVKFSVKELKNGFGVYANCGDKTFRIALQGKENKKAAKDFKEIAEGTYNLAKAGYDVYVHCVVEVILIRVLFNGQITDANISVCKNHKLAYEVCDFLNNILEYAEKSNEDLPTE